MRRICLCGRAELKKEAKMPKIIHTGDLHLDSPFSLLDVQKAQARKNELREVFSSLIDCAGSEKADIFLIAGDLFDSGYATPETVELINAKFASLPQCRFIITPGNHDPADAKGPYLNTVFPENVYIFDKPEVSRLEFPEINTDVYGFGCIGEFMDASPIKEEIGVNPERVNIFVCHADMTSKKGGLCPPITEDDIAKTHCDYFALGHIHAGTKAEKAGETYYAYCGCPEGRSFDECGQKSAIICDASKAESKKNLSFEYRRFFRRRYERLTVDVTGAQSTDDAKEKIKAELLSKSLGENALVRVTLEGRISPEVNLRTEKIKAEDTGVYYLEISDDTLPEISFETLQVDLSIKGALYRELLPKLESTDERERKIAALALRYALDALDGRAVIDY